MARRPRITAPRFHQLGLAVTATLRVYDGATAVVPDSGTYKLLDGDGNEAIAAADTNNADGAATRALVANALDAYELPQATAWREVWTLTFSGVVETHEREVYVCRVAPVCVVVDEDLFRLHAQWREFAPPNRGSWAAVIDEAFDQIVSDLVGDGILPHQVLNTWRLRKAVLYLAAHLVANDLATSEERGGKWTKLAADYQKAAELAYGKLAVKVDADQDGVADDGESQQVVEPELFLTHVPRWGR
jgi:hypothetical protein